MDITYIPMTRGFVYLAVVRIAEQRENAVAEFFGDLVWPCDLDATQQIRIDFVSRLGLRRARTAIEPIPIRRISVFT